MGRGKMERVVRGTYPRSHLGRRGSEEAARLWRAAAGFGVRGAGAVGKQRGRAAAGEELCDEPIYRRGKAVEEGATWWPASELGGALQWRWGRLGGVAEPPKTTGPGCTDLCC